jgi:hypothetical protein
VDLSGSGREINGEIKSTTAKAMNSNDLRTQKWRSVEVRKKKNLRCGGGGGGGVYSNYYFFYNI